MRKFNQYQANHDPGTRAAGANGFYGLIRVVVLLCVLFLALWLVSLLVR
jgi:hypothetical protein